MSPRHATRERPYFYKLSGLDNVVLVGIDVYLCPKCSFEAPIIPRVAALHGVIAHDLTFKRGLLCGNEIRFLRKHAALPANQFARLIGITPQHLSRVENGHTKAL